MGDPPRHSEPEEDAGAEADRRATGGTRRRLWSMLGGILVIAIAIALFVLIVFLHLTGTLGPGAH